MPRERKDKIERLIWVMNGVLEHNVSIKRLFSVLRTYEFIGLVPSDYNYAELYFRNEESYHMEQLKSRIENHKGKNNNKDGGVNKSENWDHVRYKAYSCLIFTIERS